MNDSGEHPQQSSNGLDSHAVAVRVDALRHELRTYLHHITGYCEIIKADAREHERDELIPGINQIILGAEKLHRLIGFFFGISADQPPDEGDDTADESADDGFDSAHDAFFPPLLRIISDARRLLVYFREVAPSLVGDMELLLSSANQMLDLLDEELNDLADSARTAPQSSADPAQTPATPYIAAPAAIAAPATVGATVAIAAATATATDPSPSVGAHTPQATETADSEPMLLSKHPSNVVVLDAHGPSRRQLEATLSAQGHRVHAFVSPAEALDFARVQPTDLVVMDIHIPGDNGYHIIKAFKDEPTVQTVPIIVHSQVAHNRAIARCLKLGVEDFLSKPADPLILTARIDACLEKSGLRRQQELFVQALLESQKALVGELADAADYVQSLLPKPLSGPVESAIVFIPSTQLGGDFLGYHWLDDDSLAVYSLDVSGHGIKSALLAVSLTNLLKTRGLPDVDFCEPAAVLSSLNRTFQMSETDYVFFTIFYGVFNRPLRRFRFSTAGSPPAFLRRSGSTQPMERLATGDILIGADDEFAYSSSEVTIAPGDRLFVFSDGIYETTRSTGRILGLDDFAKIVAIQEATPAVDIAEIIHSVRAVAMAENFADDVSIMELLFQG